MNYFRHGFKKMIPILTGVIPFGAVMGTVTADAKLSMGQSIAMNILAYAGAAQLAAVDLMTKNAPILVVVVTGLIINLRFLLYSAAISPVIQKSNISTKSATAYFLTDQSYAVMSAHQHELPGTKETIQFYFGGAICMALAWHISVIAGYLFGNFAPASWSLDYAVPLSFVALLIPALKNRTAILVAVFSMLLALIFKPLPYNLGLVASAFLAMILAAILTKKKIKV